jgi:hypothetical protein
MLATEEEEEMNNYDRFLAVRAKLAQIHDAGYAVDRLRQVGVFTGAVEAFQPGQMTKEKRELEAWESAACKDARRAVKVLLTDYFAIKGELEALLAAS